MSVAGAGTTFRTPMRLAGRLFAPLLAAMSAACGGGDSGPESATFALRLRDLPASEEFRFHAPDVDRTWPA